MEGMTAEAGSAETIVDSSSQATATSNRRARRSKRRKRARKRKVCRRKKGKLRCRWVAEFNGRGVSERQLRTEPLARPSGELTVYAVNFREEVTVDLYDENGELNDRSLAELDGLFRCRRTQETRAMDPRLYEILSVIYDHFGKRRIELISGFRNQSDNETSRHFHASAMDIRIPGVSTRTLYKFVTSLDVGGMGIGRYPVSGFVHVDFRAPGAKSYRWTDYSPSGNTKKRRNQRKSRRTRPNV